MSSQNKKTYPLVILQELNQFKRLVTPPFRIEDNSNFLLFIKDARYPEFYFGISGYGIVNGAGYYQFVKRPASHIELGLSSHTASSSIAVTANYKSWANLCDEYDEIDSPFIDLEVEQAEDEIFEDWKILDEDADSARFPIPQQIFLTAAIERIKKNIVDADEETISQGQKEDLIWSLAAVQDDLTTHAKNGIIKRFANIAAKARKASVKVGNFLLKEFTKEVLKESAKHLINMNPHTVGIWLHDFGETVRGLIS